MFVFYHKRVLIWLLIIFILFTVSSDLAYAQSRSEVINLSAKGAALIDVASGRILYQKNADQKMRIASLTKIMTAIVAIENGKLDDLVTTSDKAFGVEGSSIYLKRGEKLSLENMLYGLMLRSGNDAAVAIAEHIGGSLEGFVYLMNEKAEYLGMNNTHFMNPNGLDHQKHYSTPKDMAILTAYALKNSTFRKIVSTKIKTAPVEGEKWDRKWYNKNKLLNMYEWADGVKTGYTKLANRCLASSASKDGRQLASITLNAPDDWRDHIKMLEFGFNNYSQQTLIKTDEYVGNVNVNDSMTLDILSERDFTYPLKKEEKKFLIKKLIITNKDNISNHAVGKIELYLNDEYIGSVPVRIKDKNVFSESVKNAWRSIWRGE